MTTKKRKHRTLSIGGATYDVFLRIRPEQEKLLCNAKKIFLDLGGKIPIEQVIESCGGGASNTSVGLARLGCQASFCGIVGEDQWGEKLIQNMQNEQVNTASATIIQKESSSFSFIIVLSTGERTILYNAGVNEHLQDATFDREALTRTDAIYLNHLCERSCMIENDIMEKLREKPSTHLTWNPGGAQIQNGYQASDTAALLRETTLFIVNREEALQFTRTETKADALGVLMEAGVEIACITDGSNGAIARKGEEIYVCQPQKNIPIADTTGAGDAFGCAATWAILSGYDLPNMLIAGTLNAANVLRNIGAQYGLLTDTEIHSLMTQNLVTPQEYRKE